MLVVVGWLRPNCASRVLVSDLLHPSFPSHDHASRSILALLSYQTTRLTHPTPSPPQASSRPHYTPPPSYLIPPSIYSPSRQPHGLTSTLHTIIYTGLFTTITKMGWRRRLEEAKQKHRPRLKDWGRDGLATDRKLDFAGLDYLPSPHTQHRQPQQHRAGTVDRVHCRDLSPEAFVEQYEKLSKPLVIQGVPESEGWRATERWASEGALRRRFRKYAFKCGEDDDGRSIRVRLKHFFKYVGKQKDDSPLYIFDSTYDDDKEAKALLEDYAVPSYFPDDLFSLVGEKRRPPYRWFLVGPKRSGTSLHIDPLGTSAWNTVLTGRKRWILFPPSTPRDLAKGKALYRKGEDDEPINYFVDILPRLRALRASEGLVFYEFIQEEGETVFVPGGWWHGTYVFFLASLACVLLGYSLRLFGCLSVCLISPLIPLLNPTLPPSLPPSSSTSQRCSISRIPWPSPRTLPAGSTSLLFGGRREREGKKWLVRG